MRDINKIIIHCSATKEHQNFSTGEIRRWHMNGNGWSDIGYHWVIERNGHIGKGRDESVIGAHTRGHNIDSIGICLVGGLDKKGRAEDNFTDAQYESLEKLLSIKCIEFNVLLAWVYGHNKFDKRKACPCFNIERWMERIDWEKYCKEENKWTKLIKLILSLFKK